MVKFNQKIDVIVQCQDALQIECDVLAVKYAQGFHGADQAVAVKLKLSKAMISPLPGEKTLIDSAKSLAAKQVLFVGVPPLRLFNYRKIYDFTLQVMEILLKDAPDTRHLAMTMHGVNFGLDEREAFHSQLSGIERCLYKQKFPPLLEKITIVELNKRRAERLQQMLDEYEPMMSQGIKLNPEPKPTADSKPDEPNSKSTDLIVLEKDNSSSVTELAVTKSDQKPHVFVAMPFSEEMEDVFVFGIQGPVHAAGLLCERVDMAVFTGDILERIRSRIASASLVIADLTGANANVYLEVGYAWGKSRPTLLIMRSGEQLKFDVIGQRCIFYKSITDLKTKIEADLAEMRLLESDGK